MILLLFVDCVTCSKEMRTFTSDLVHKHFLSFSSKSISSDGAWTSGNQWEFDKPLSSIFMYIMYLLIQVIQSKTLVKVVHRMCTFPCKSGTSQHRPMYVKLGQADVCNIVKLVSAWVHQLLQRWVRLGQEKFIKYCKTGTSWHFIAIVELGLRKCSEVFVVVCWLASTLKSAYLVTVIFSFCFTHSL